MQLLRDVMQNHNLLKNLHWLKHNFHRYQKLISNVQVFTGEYHGAIGLIIRKGGSCNIFNIFLAIYTMYKLSGYIAFPCQDDSRSPIRAGCQEREHHPVGEGGFHVGTPPWLHPSRPDF